MGGQQKLKGCKPGGNAWSMNEEITADSSWACNGLGYRHRCHGWLILLRGKMTEVARQKWQRSVWEK